MIKIREATKSDLSVLYDLYRVIGKKDDGYFEHMMEQGAIILIASLDGEDCGFCIYNPRPRYSVYRKLGIPEIQDLNVIPAARRNGVASALIKWCEGMARSRNCSQIGISVGLFKDYGPAQILYTKMGYVPDGNGVTYDRESIRPYTSYIIDDNLSLMMVKDLV